MHISEPYIHPPLPLMADPAITKGEKKRGAQRRWERSRPRSWRRSWRWRLLRNNSWSRSWRRRGSRPELVEEGLLLLQATEFYDEFIHEYRPSCPWWYLSSLSVLMQSFVISSTSSERKAKSRVYIDFPTPERSDNHLHFIVPNSQPRTNGDKATGGWHIGAVMLPGRRRFVDGNVSSTATFRRRRHLNWRDAWPWRKKGA